MGLVEKTALIKKAGYTAFFITVLHPVLDVLG
jgi:hypothetical protein